MEDVSDDGDLDPTGDWSATGRHHKVGVLGDADVQGDRPPKVDPARGELAEPLGPRRPILADRQVLAQEGRGHRLGLLVTPRFDRTRHRRT